MNQTEIEVALSKFETLLRGQLDRVDQLKHRDAVSDFEAMENIRIGVCGGDGIGPIITAEAQRVLQSLLKDDPKFSFVTIEGLTLENRIAHAKAIPDDVLTELKTCPIILKGPTTTPQAGDGLPNLESANVRMRKELDLYANVRPVKVPEKGIDWTFFRENTEGGYSLGSDGFNVNSDLAFDFVVTTTIGTQRIARMAYEFAAANNKDRVSIVTKANVIKTTDGNFLNLCREISKDYPSVTTDEWYIDIMTAKLIDERRRRDFKVFVLPNLYGDIITDEAAEFQGGVGTAGSANLGDQYAMFEAIHGSAPRMIREGRGAYADPSSMLRACVLLLRHVKRPALAEKLEASLDFCMFTDQKLKITGRSDGASSADFTNYILDNIK